MSKASCIKHKKKLEMKMYHLNYLIYRKYKNKLKNKSENILNGIVEKIDCEIFWGDGNPLYFILAAYSHQIPLNGTHTCAFYYMYIRYNDIIYIYCYITYNDIIYIYICVCVCVCM